MIKNLTLNQSICKLLILVFVLAGCEDLILEDTTPTYEPKFKIDSFYPLKAGGNDTLRIFGSNFGSQNEKVTVFLGYDRNTSIKPISVTPTLITLIVPSQVVNDNNPREPIKGTVKVSIDTLGTVETKEVFSYLFPAIGFSFTPNEVRPGELIMVTGPHDRNNMDSVRVRFSNSNVWSYPVGSSKQYRFLNVLIRVPKDAKTGQIEIETFNYSRGKTTEQLNILPEMPSVKVGEWTQRGNILGSSSKAGATVLTLQNRAYIVSGTTAAPLDGFGSSEVWEFDPGFNSWMQKGDAPFPRRAFASGFSIGNRGFVGTGLGSDQKPLKDFWEYNPLTDTWTARQDFPGTARGYAIGFTLNGLGYIGTGSTSSSSSSNTVFDDFFVYSPVNNSWSPSISIPIKRTQSFSFVINEEVYVGGGFNINSSNQKVRLYDLFKFSPLAQEWSVKAGINGYDFTAMNSAFTIQGKGVVGLGYNPTATLNYTSSNIVYEYNPTSNSWRLLPRLGNSNRTGAIGFSVNNIGYFGLGFEMNGLGTHKDLWGIRFD